MPKILKAGTYGFYDVFIGNGWEGHTRVRWNKKVGHLQFVSGKHLSKTVVQQVLAYITEKASDHTVVEPVKEEKEYPLSMQSHAIPKPHLYVVK